MSGVILQCIVPFNGPSVESVIKVEYHHLRGERGCYYGRCVLRHVLSVGRVQTHGKGKRRRLNETVQADVCPLRERTGSVLLIRSES